MVHCENNEIEEQARIFVKSQVRRLNLKSKSVDGGCVELNYEVRLKEDSSTFVNELEAMPGVSRLCWSPTTATIWDKAMVKHKYIDWICMGAAVLAVLLTLLLMFGEQLGNSQSQRQPGICDPLV